LEGDGARAGCAGRDAAAAFLASAASDSLQRGSRRKRRWSALGARRSSADGLASADACNPSARNASAALSGAASAEVKLEA
jgi:hypothetical protein